MDEYQDCSIPQHELVLRLARDLPCRVLGDDLQGIFDFNGDPVDWARDVSGGHFEPLGRLETPHRWNRAGTPEIGAWLAVIRQRLKQGQPIDLRQSLPHGVKLVLAHGQADLSRIQGNTCRYFDCELSESVAAIHKGTQQYKSKCHKLARHLGGRFSSIEEIEGKEVFSFVEKIRAASTSHKRLKEVLALACKCMTGVKERLPAATLRGEHADIRQNTHSPSVANAANAYIADPTSTAMAGLLTAIKAVSGVQVIRADLFNRVMGVLHKHKLYPQLTLDEAAEKYHSEFRRKGRPTGRRKVIGTTLLVKGLEFDHAIVLEADSLSTKELYVALTRGAKSLTIISSSPVLNPTD